MCFKRVIMTGEKGKKYVIVVINDSKSLLENEGKLWVYFFHLYYLAGKVGTECFVLSSRMYSSPKTPFLAREKGKQPVCLNSTIGNIAVRFKVRTTFRERGSLSAYFPCMFEGARHIGDDDFVQIHLLQHKQLLTVNVGESQSFSGVC